MADFFRTQPAGIGDIGYWNNHFYIKDITMAEFLAEQVINRIKIEFREDKYLKENFILKAVKGSYTTKGGRRILNFELLADRSVLGVGNTIEDSDRIFATTLSVAGQVVHGYHFNDFDAVSVLDQRAGRSIEVTPEELEAFRAHKKKLEEIGK